MTPGALERKRLEELLRVAKRTRHLAQAMRTPAARLARFGRAAAQAWAKSTAKLLRVKGVDELQDLEPLVVPDEKDLLGIVTELAKTCASNEAAVQRRLVAIKKSGRASKPSKPIDERIKGRRAKKAKASERSAAYERARAKWERDTKSSAERLLGKMPTDKQAEVLEKVARDASANNAMNRSILRHAGAEDFADELLAVAKREPKR